MRCLQLLMQQPHKRGRLGLKIRQVDFVVIVLHLLEYVKGQQQHQTMGVCNYGKL